MSDAPDFTLAGHMTLIGTIIMLPIDVQGSTIMMPIDIQGQTVNVAIDIAAQSIGNIAIDIAAQSVGNVAVNIAASAITLNVAIQSSAVTLNVAIQSSAVTLNVNISSQSAFNLNVNLAASAITLNVNISSQSAFNLNVNIAASAVTLNVAIQSSAVTLNVAIQSSAVTLNVAITGSVTLNVAIQSSAVTLNVAITGSVTLNVNISSQSAFNLNVNLAASAVTLDVDIAAQTVDLNIKTSGGTNIVIDKLTQGAFTGRSVDLRNDNGVTTPTAPPNSVTNTTYKGKHFPRGCRGSVDWISIYCKRTGSGTLTLSVAPYPGAGAVWTIAITPGSSWDWKSGTVNKMWNYDSMFIWVSACSSDVSYGRDSTVPTDAFTSADSGVTWAAEAYRYFIWVGSRGQTVGDLPVSGTLNTIEIPSISAERMYASQTVTGGAGEVTMKEVLGAGASVFLLISVSAATNSHNAQLKVYCDGVCVWFFTPYGLNGDGFTASTMPIALLKYAENGDCIVFLTLPFKFRRSLKLTIAVSTSTGCWIDGTANLLA